jgi:hypothetical protein
MFVITENIMKHPVFVNLQQQLLRTGRVHAAVRNGMCRVLGNVTTAVKQLTE